MSRYRYIYIPRTGLVLVLDEGIAFAIHKNCNVRIRLLVQNTDLTLFGDFWDFYGFLMFCQFLSCRNHTPTRSPENHLESFVPATPLSFDLSMEPSMVINAFPKASYLVDSCWIPFVKRIFGLEGDLKLLHQLLQAFNHHKRPSHAGLHQIGVTHGLPVLGIVIPHSYVSV